jgi:hypothetical protein
MDNEPQGHDLTEDTSQMPSESAVHTGSELRKRRSTRIVQAVPLVVTGVDALGRPFAERTSTLIINCHGCRYQSKHYVLKNMWVNLEVPHPEPGHPPRQVRGKVAWIQRPRTVRQLFQVALELETAGNAWGIGFPPDDWFTYPEVSAPVNPASPGDLPAALGSSFPHEAPLPLVEAEPGVATPDNVRVFPAPASATDASLQLARQVARLLAEAKQQIQAAAHDAAAQAVANERRLAFEEWERKYSGFRDDVARETAQAIGHIQEESETRARTAQASAAESLKNELPRWLAPQLEQLTHELMAHLAREGSAQREQHEKQLSSAQETLQTLFTQADETGSKLRTQAESLEAQVAARLEEAKRKAEAEARQLEQSAGTQHQNLAATAEEVNQRVASVVGEAQNSLKEQVSREIEGAQARLKETVETTVRSAQDQAAALLEQAKSLRAEIQEESAKQHAAVQGTVENTVRSAQDQATAGLLEQAKNLRAEIQEEGAKHVGVLQGIVENSVRTAQDQATAALLEQANGLRAVIQEESAKQNAVLQASVESTLRTAQEQATAALLEQAKNLRTEFLDEGAKQNAALRESLAEQAKHLEETLGRAKEATERLEQIAPRIETVQQQALGGFQSQLDDVLTLHRNELHRRSENLFEEIHGRIRSSFEAANSDALAKFDDQVKSMVAPHITQAEEAVHRLAGGRSLLDAAMTMQQDRVRNTADEAFADAMGRFRDNLGTVEQLLNESAQGITARNLEELEAKAVDLKHSTMEEMFKSAEWYEKKTQSQVQHLTEKIVEQTGAQLREKAGEVSSLFASELSHASRSYVSQSNEQLQESVRDAFERVRMLFAEAADTTSAAFTDEIQRNARMELDGFNELIQKTLEQSREQMDAARAELNHRVTTEQEEFLRRFQGTMTEAVGKGLNEAQAKVQSSFGNVLDSWKALSEAKLTELRSGFGQISDASAEQYRGRLENISNSWMVATVATLDHQSRDVIAKIAATAEERLREASAEVFAKFGDTLRERLQQIAAGFDRPGTKS